MMHSLINFNFNRTYNPNERRNALSDIKRLLTSRDTVAQKKACGYLIEVINRYNKNSNETRHMLEYLLDNDITVFLCEATSNLDFSLFRSILQCIRSLWHERRFFLEEHAAHSMAAVLRALVQYANQGSHAAVEACLHFLCDLLNCVSTFETTPPLCHQSAYNAEQLLACFKSLALAISINSKGILFSALVLHALLSYQPDNLTVRSSTAAILIEVLKQWFTLLIGALNHSMLVGDTIFGMFFLVTCQLCMDVLRLIKLLHHGNQRTDFVHSILVDEQEINLLKQYASEFMNSVQSVILELVTFTKENQHIISTEEYGVFLKILLNFLYDHSKTEAIACFCDVLFSKGYLTMLPQVQILRNDVTVRRVSTLVLGEMLKVLSEKYLNINEARVDDGAYARDIHMDLVELQYGIEKPHCVGIWLQKNQPYGVLIYIYFYCQSPENREETIAPLLQHLVEHILSLPKTFKPPPYIIKALWLVFAMSTISNRSLRSLEERVYLEKATERLIAMLHPDPSLYYTHHPAILLWAFTSLRIPNYVRFHILTQWLKREDSLPADLTKNLSVWEDLLNVLTQNKNKAIAMNCMKTIQTCLDEGDEDGVQDFALLVWSMLPTVLSKALINYNNEIEPNICYLLDLASYRLPPEVDQTICLKIAVLITATFPKTNQEPSEHWNESKHHYEFVCLKLSLYLLGLANNQNDNTVLLTYLNRAGFLPSVLSATNSSDDRVACAALQLLCYIVHYFNKNNYQPKSILQIQTHLIIESLRRDSSNERGAALLQLVYMVLNSGSRTPLVLSHNMPAAASETQQCNALRALMFRIQMLCCREFKNQSSAVASSSWKTLTSIYKHAILTNNDTKIVATLTSQPWTHTLIHFQITQNITQDFLTYLHTWLTLLKITIKKSQEEKRRQIYRHSPISKTLKLLKIYLKLEEDETKELKERILVVVNDTLNECGIKDIS